MIKGYSVGHLSEVCWRMIRTSQSVSVRDGGATQNNIDEIVRVKKARTMSAEAVLEALNRYVKREKLSIAKLQDRIVQARRSVDDLAM